MFDDTPDPAGGSEWGEMLMVTLAMLPLIAGGLLLTYLLCWLFG